MRNKAANWNRGRLSALLLLAMMIAVLSGCGGGSRTPAGDTSGSGGGQAEQHPAEHVNPYKDDNNPVVTFELEGGGKIVAELYPEAAPNTVNNFISLVEQGFYDGLTFHRVIPGFMLQGGDPTGTGMGGPGYAIKGEFAANEFPNELKHTRGVLSMARTQDPDSAGSQFFIMHADAPHLDNQYAAFGEVVDGIEYVDLIAGVETDAMDKPTTAQVMVKVTVDTKGKNYPGPEKVE